MSKTESIINFGMNVLGAIFILIALDWFIPTPNIGLWERLLYEFLFLFGLLLWVKKIDFEERKKYLFLWVPKKVDKNEVEVFIRELQDEGFPYKVVVLHDIDAKMEFSG